MNMVYTSLKHVQGTASACLIGNTTNQVKYRIGSSQMLVFSEGTSWSRVEKLNPRTCNMVQSPGVESRTQLFLALVNQFCSHWIIIICRDYDSYYYYQHFSQCWSYQFSVIISSGPYWLLLLGLPYYCYYFSNKYSDY